MLACEVVGFLRMCLMLSEGSTDDCAVESSIPFACVSLVTELMLSTKS